MDFKILSVVLGIVLFISIILNITIPFFICKNDDYPTKSSLLENADYIISGLTTDQNTLLNAYLNPENDESSMTFISVLKDSYNMTQDQIDNAVNGIVNDIGLSQFLDFINSSNTDLSLSDSRDFWLAMQTLSMSQN
tara:strand:- start:154 stop:564 length:411 start_codon:yes stop_codon:yes gene_type:complete